MKKTNGGYRAMSYETIVAADKAGYLDRVLYAVEGLPGVWRRARTPKGEAIASGLLPCWYDGSVICLEYSGAVNDELNHATVTVENPEEMIAFLDGLRERRADAIMKERGDEPGTAMKGLSEDSGSSGMESAISETATTAPDVPAPAEVEV